jgi:integrase
MPKRITPLSDIQVRNAKSKLKEYKMMDGFGLYLLVTPTNGKLWRFDYRYGDKRKVIAFGAYPAISLADARQRREEAKKLLANGIDPGEVKKAQKAAIAAETENGFEVVAREWHTKFSKSWTPGHADTIMSRLERDVFPWLGSKPIGDIKPVELLAVLRRVEGRGALETAHRIRTIAGQVLRYAVATGRAERDVAADLRGALPPTQERHHAAITDPKEVAELLRAIDGFKGTFHVKCALQLAPMLFVRPGELRQMEWVEIDFDATLWNIPAEKMKMKQAHIVPLCKQAVAILKELRPLTGHSKYVFPCHRTPLRPMTNNAINAALRRMGYTSDDQTGHGFRAMARTILDEVLHVRPDFIEHQLAHAVRDPNGRAYNRTAHLSERRRMMQVWADYLEGLKQGAKIIPMHYQAVS